MSTRTRARGLLAATSTALLAAGLLSSCSSNNADPLTQNLDGRGPITYVEGKDTTASGVVKQLIAKWNASHPNEQVRFQEQSNDGGQQHDDLVQHLQSKSSDYDVVAMDVTYTAEFAARKWIQPLKDKFTLDTAGLLEPTVASATYRGTLYAAPKNTNGGLLFYRKDLVPAPPKTWAELNASCAIARERKIDCYAGQFAPYEGLTVNAAEVINAYGGRFVSEDGTTPTINSPQARAGLSVLADAFKNGNIAHQALSYKEPESGQHFKNNNVLYVRNWPSFYDDANSSGSLVAGKFAAAPLPGGTRMGASTLGGYNAAISAFSKHKATAHDFLKFLISAEAQQLIAESALPPTRSALYDDPKLAAKFPYLPALKASLTNAVARPVTPYYPAVTKAISTEAYAAISGQKPVDQAITDMQKGIEAAGRVR